MLRFLLIYKVLIERGFLMLFRMMNVCLFCKYCCNLDFLLLIFFIILIWFVLFMFFKSCSCKEVIFWLFFDVFFVIFFKKFDIGNLFLMCLKIFFVSVVFLILFMLKILILYDFWDWFWIKDKNFEVCWLSVIGKRDFKCWRILLIMVWIRFVLDLDI